MGRGKAQHNVELIATAFNILEEIHPASVRAVCYQLFIRHMIGSMRRNETNRVSKQLVDAREGRFIPWDWIVDETRKAERVASWNDPEAFARAASEQYRRDFWQQQPTRVEVWSEKGTIRGAIEPVLRKYGITFRVFHGSTSATVVRDVCEAHLAQRKPFIALYVGDCDPAGMCMSEKDLPNRLHQYWTALCEEHRLAWWDRDSLPGPVLRRIAMTPGDGLAMPAGTSFSAHTKRGDSNYRWYVDEYGDSCWELDAMNPNDLRQRVEQAIRAEIKWQPWRRCKKAEAAEQATLKMVLKNWHTGKVFGCKPPNTAGATTTP